MVTSLLVVDHASSKSHASPTITANRAAVYPARIRPRVGRARVVYGRDTARRTRPLRPDHAFEESFDLAPARDWIGLKEQVRGIDAHEVSVGFQSSDPRRAPFGNQAITRGAEAQE